MPDQIITVPHEEDFPSSPVETIDENGIFIAQRTLIKVPWEQRFDLILQLLGGPYDDGGGTDPVVFPPHRYPYRTTARAVKITNMRGWAPDHNSPVGIHGNTVAHYRYATMQVEYRESISDDPDNSPDGQPLVEETFEAGAEFLSTTGRKLYWATGAQDKVDDIEAPSLLVPRASYSVKLRKLSVIPAAALSLQGKTNSAAVTSPKYNLTFPQETMLYLAPEITADVRLPNGNLGHDVEYKFLLNPHTWNKFFKAGNTTPQILYDAAGTALTGANGFAPTGNFAGILPGVFF